MTVFLRKNMLLLIVLAVLLVLFIAAANGMEPKDFVITLLRGLSVGSLTFLVASGFSLIFGLLDVLNLAHGTLFMIGAYIGWTVYVRPDTFVDLLTPIALILSGFLLRRLVDGSFIIPEGGYPEPVPGANEAHPALGWDPCLRPDLVQRTVALSHLLLEP